MPGTVIRFAEYKAQREISRKVTRACGKKGLPDSANLWELLDRNISLEVWKKEI